MINRVHFKLSSNHAACGRWGHRPRRDAPVGVPTNRRCFEMHLINNNLLNK